jgi:hypothetical protein
MIHLCKHSRLARSVKAQTEGCAECLTAGDPWIHLRICLICGHVGCCDASRNRHATQHFHATKHPVVQSLEPDEHWRWCYIDQTFF